MVLALGMVASASVCQCMDFDFAGRLSGGADSPFLSSTDLRLECALGLPEFSFVGWVDVDPLLLSASTFGGELSLTRDWLSLAIIARQGESQIEVAAQGRANPTSWLLWDGVPTLLGGMAASAEIELFGGTGASEIVLSPFFTGVIPAGETTVTPSIGADVRVDSETQALTVSGSRLVATVHAGCVLIANTVHFDGLFEVFSSLVMSVNVPEWGLTVTGSLIPTGSCSFSYRIGVSYEWGDTYLLPIHTDKPKTVCTGGVCF